ATGERPFGNPTGVHGLRRRLYRDPVPPRAIAPACPPWLQEIILHCLEIDPRARYDTAAQVAFQCKHPEQTMLTARCQRMSATASWPWPRGDCARWAPKRTPDSPAAAGFRMPHSSWLP